METFEFLAKFQIDQQVFANYLSLISKNLIFFLKFDKNSNVFLNKFENHTQGTMVKHNICVCIYIY